MAQASEDRVLDYGGLQPGGAATAAVREADAKLPFVRDNTARVRITGSVALDDDEFASVEQGVVGGLIGSLVLMIGWLFLALGTWRTIVPVVLTLLLGLVLTAAFAAAGIDDWEHLVRQDAAFFRPADPTELVGDASRARAALGWAPTVQLEEIVARMVAADL